MSLGPTRRSTTALLGLLLGTCSGIAQAQLQRSMVNPSFELPGLGGGSCRVYIDAARVPGWSTTHPPAALEVNAGCVASAFAGGVRSNVPIIELWSTPRNGLFAPNTSMVYAPDGLQVAELNAAQASRLYQDVCLLQGELVRWSFAHRGRFSGTAPDVADFLLGATQVVRVATVNDGNPLGVIQAGIGTVTPITDSGGTQQWMRYSGTATYTGASGMAQVGFQAISTGNNQLDTGNLLDDVHLTLPPLVEFAAAASSDRESTGGNLPQLRVTGEVPAGGITVQVDITGGAATPGADYAATSPIMVTVPAGDYSVTPGLFSVPLGIQNDSLRESDETITLGLLAASGYTLGSTHTCGEPALVNTTYTILDDDIALVKTAAAPMRAPGGAFNEVELRYTLTVTGTPEQPGVYTLIDTPALEPDVTIINASVQTQGSSTPLAGPGPWTLASSQALPAGATHTYVVTVRARIVTVEQGGSRTNNSCTGQPGHGLFNTSQLTQVPPVNPALAANACADTPDPLLASVPAQGPHGWLWLSALALLLALWQRKRMA